MSYHSLSSFSELTLQDPVTDIHPTIMKGIRPTSRSQPNHDVLQFIDPSNIEQEARDNQDQRNQDVMPDRRKENYSKQVEVTSDHSFLAEKQKMIEEQKRMMEEQKQFLAEKQKMMEEQKQFLAEKQRVMELEAKLRAYTGAHPQPPHHHHPQQTDPSSETAAFEALTASGIISLNNSDVDSIKKQIADDGANKITSFIWFYAHWCGYCTRIISTMDEVARSMKDYNDKVKIYMINGNNKQDIMSSFNIRGFPTLNVYHGQPGVPTPYTGDRSASDMINFLKLEMNK